MQLSQNTITKFGLGVPETVAGDPLTHMPSQGVGSNILYNNNPSNSAVYDPNADAGFLRDINTGQEIRASGSTVFGYKAPKQIASAKVSTGGPKAASNPFSNKPAASSSFTASTFTPKAVTQTNVKPSSTPQSAISRPPPGYTGAPINYNAPINNTKVNSVSSGASTKKPSSGPVKITPAMQTAANNIGNLLKNILNTALFGGRK